MVVRRDLTQTATLHCDTVRVWLCVTVCVRPPSQSDAPGAFPSRASTTELVELATTINTGVSGSMCAVLSDNARHTAIFHDVKPTAWSNEFQPYEVLWSRCWGKHQHNVFQPNPR